ncbi:hypothetical protein HPB52_022902 [Rhipicephalus sanguineus]|uniref:Uncharacterized protein n=1 Tax=Rhipicephalus sanguineus TaxID=34632 RepID=A0A9D4T2C1_RHISA|nr:hypothetical protein HPB52_022902 [Rhipicephalus sanguineus]
MFLRGKVRQLASFKVGKRGDGIVILAAKVQASQTLTKQYEPWCIVEDDGSVVTAHCTCMAGDSEATDSAPETADHCPEAPTKQRKVSATFPLGDIYKDVDLETA